MNTTPTQPWRWPRFTIRGVLIVTLMVALLVGWSSSARRATMRLSRALSKLRYAEEELTRARDELEYQARPKRNEARVLWAVQLDGTHLRGVTISSQSNAFQRASLKECDLQSATLQGGGAAFQFSRFDHANLIDATLTGGGASFQEAVFDGADLTRAVLDGGGSSFQGASFENATLVGARMSGSFQLVNISGAHFEGADLSALDSDSLVSCYFKEPPIYDAQTQFPNGFDPEAKSWRRVTD